ncbi:MAG: hypothetical protein M3065_10565 [Actinomycetota bacterium]|nr:hypothetical protein [Actinomycetota bacterium]
MTSAPPDKGIAAWLSLDESDNDPALFWTYFIATLRSAAPGVGERALALFSSTEPPTEAFVVTLLNDLAAVSDAIVVVLDDYHVIEEPQVGTVGLSGGARPGGRSGWSSPVGPIRRCRWRPFERAASSSRSVPPICASPSTRPRPISTT